MTRERASRPLPFAIIVVLGALTGVGALSLDAYLPAFPAIAIEFDVARAGVQLSLTACLVGFAAGQLVAGPVSDAVGRRLPLVIGAVGYAAASFACAFAPEIATFVVLRFAQGVFGAVGVVAARAVIRDVAEGPVAVRLFSQLSTANALAPVLAPVLGAVILSVSDWRGVFVVLGGFGALLGVVLITLFRETHPPAKRHPGTPRAVARAFAGVLADVPFLGVLAIGVCAAVTLFAYVSGSSFVLQETFGADPALFAVSFAINGLGIAVLSQVNARLAPRRGSAHMLRAAFAVQAASALGLLAIALFAPRDPSVIPVLMVAFFGLVAPMGIVTPNYIALGMGRVRANGGMASALLGATTFFAGGVISPLSGLGDPVLTMAGLVSGGALCGLVLAVRAARAGAPRGAVPA
jgi:DHA1 family bicyclomycin/chloramphenicol resistance-like MFS transporter